MYNICVQEVCFLKYPKEVYQMSALNEEQVSVYMRKLPEWKVQNQSIVKTYPFTSFAEAMSFVNQVAQQAEVENHHPDIWIQNNKVTLSLTTHDKRGITGKDFLLAQHIEEIIKTNFHPFPDNPE